MRGATRTEILGRRPRFAFPGVLPLLSLSAMLRTKGEHSVSAVLPHMFWLEANKPA